MTDWSPNRSIDEQANQFLPEKPVVALLFMEQPEVSLCCVWVSLTLFHIVTA